MVAKTPTKQKKMSSPPINPNLLRETVNKASFTGGTKTITGKNLSPRSTRGYLRTSMRCKQESLRIKNSAGQKSPIGKFQGSTCGEWRQMSLPAMLVGETVVEILQASRFAKEIVTAVDTNKKKTQMRTSYEDPKTPVSYKRNNNSKVHHTENTEMRDKRKREKQVVFKLIRSESDLPSLQRARARSRINFKVSSPIKRDLVTKQSILRHHVANRVSPRNKPWAKKTVLFPNPLFHSSPMSHQNKFCKTRSPVIARATHHKSPHKFLIKTPPSTSKYHVKIKSPCVSLSPTRLSAFSKKSLPKVSTASKLRRSFSPSKLVNRFVSPLKNRMSLQRSSSGNLSGLKQRPSSTPLRFSDWRI
ncbi:hypothetical protein GIB67_029078 [Kingdonia uniflora]|uniref:Microtubule-binding protein TANGLED n=1 Tax=Kingdonia uniflora TaxID=39325 RepID=A0A7J7N6F6_9MAGN|nr:hypothetical protein GIB67_029078 [Kingdonia uniflora]